MSRASLFQSSSKIFIGLTGVLFLGASAQAVVPLSVAVGASIVKEFRETKSAAEKQASVQLETFRDAGLNADSVVIAVDRDQAQVGLVGIDWNNLVEFMKDRHFPVESLNRLHHAEAGKLPIIVVTYPGGPKELSDAQIAKIFSGQASNWKELGGEDLPIQLVVQGNSNALRRVFALHFLKSADITAHGIHEITDPHAMSAFIEHTRGAIGIGNSSLEVAKLNQPKHSTLYRTITIFYKSEAGDKADRYRDYFRDHPLK